MDIVYNCDDRFAVHTAVSIASLFDSNRNADEINIYILGNGLSEESKRRFAGLSEAAGTGRSIEIKELADYASALKLYFGPELNTGSFDITVLARLFAPSHLPDKVSRYLYIDADTVVTGGLEEIFGQELGNCICAMVPEPTIYADVKKRIGLGADDPYYNSGVILTDRLKWEQENITGKCIDYYKTLSGAALSFPDQDILNAVLKGRILTLEPRYNFFSNYRCQSYGSLCKRAAWYGSQVSEQEYEKAYSDPAVVHFAGLERPWNAGNHNPYRRLYEKYLDMTPWKGTPRIKGHEIMMQVCFAVGLVTRYFPWARELISSAYYKFKIKQCNDYHEATTED